MQTVAAVKLWPPSSRLCSKKLNNWPSQTHDSNSNRTSHFLKS